MELIKLNLDLLSKVERKALKDMGKEEGLTEAELAEKAIKTEIYTQAAKKTLT
jgi:uncharacterized protein YnzC (UPF0291/DUF896 family)